jgi:hypothetical protein
LQICTGGDHELGSSPGARDCPHNSQFLDLMNNLAVKLKAWIPFTALLGYD